MNITDIFKIPLFRNFTQKMQDEFLENIEYTIEEHSKGKTIIHQGSPCHAIHVLLEGKLNVDVVDVSGGEVRVEVIKAPRTFATPHVFAEKNQFPATFSVEEDVVLMKIPKESFSKVMHTTPLLLHNFLCVSTSCNKCTMTRLRVLSFRGIRSRYIYYLLDHLKEGEDPEQASPDKPVIALNIFFCIPLWKKIIIVHLRRLSETGQHGKSTDY